MRYEVFVFNKYGREIDFLAQKDGKEYLIQTSYSIAEEKTTKENLPCSIHWISHAERLLSQQMNLTTQQVQSNILALQDFWSSIVWRISEIFFHLWQ